MADSRIARARIVGRGLEVGQRADEREEEPPGTPGRGCLGLVTLETAAVSEIFGSLRGYD